MKLVDLKDLYKEIVLIDEGKDKLPSKAHVMKMCKDGMTKAEMCKMHPNCDQDKLKAMIDDCKKEMKENVNEASSMNISMSGETSSEVAELMNMLKNAGMPDAKPVGPVSLPMDGPMDGPMDRPNDGHDDMVSKLKMLGKQGPASSPCEDDVEEDDRYSASTEPDPEYKDDDYMIHDLAGGLNRSKKQYTKAQDGDNPIAVENSIYEELKARYEAAKAEAKFDEMGCKKEMMKLNASGCTKESMYKKVNAEYNCGREKFEKLYASNCG
jgi:hypothetical protein|tara:strand:- start:20293 stop:21096 length:804 start_codon:yes stop_codon:yes gene_type:complete